MDKFTLIALIAIVAGGSDAPAVACELQPGVVAQVAPNRHAVRGVADANRDLKAGTAKILGYGLRPEEGGLGDQLLKKHLGLRFVSQGCIVTPEIEAYTDAYNGQVRRQLEREHGPGVIEAIWAEAQIVELIESLEDRSYKAMRHQGAVAAKNDVRFAKFLKLRFGPLAGIERALAELLHEELGVITVVMHERPEGLAAFADGYNDRMRQELRAKAGLERWRAMATEAAVTAAEHDIAEGRLVVTVWGFPGPADLHYQKLLEDRFGIELYLGGCVMPEDYDPAPYHERMVKEIEARFGEGVLEKTFAEAEQMAQAGPPAQG